MHEGFLELHRSPDMDRGAGSAALRGAGVAPLSNTIRDRAEQGDVGVVRVETIAENGLGYGEGSISRQDRLADGTLSPEVDRKVAEASKSEKATVEVTDRSCDNCPDGRCAACVQQVIDGNLNESTEKTFCYKVFGGGATMAMVGEVANGIKDKTSGVMSAFRAGYTRLKSKGILFGLHSSNHANAEKSDCGAIDNAPKILFNALKYRAPIINSMKAVFGDNYQKDGLVDHVEEVFANFEDFVNSSGYQDETYSGARVVGMLKEEGNKVKILEDQHLEVRIRINVDVDNFTTDQSYIREVAGDQAQIFALDIPRMKEIADLSYDTLEEKKRAFVGMVIYSLATAATLTKGDLPVDRVYRKYSSPRAYFKSQKDSDSRLVAA